MPRKKTPITRDKAAAILEVRLKDPNTPPQYLAAIAGQLANYRSWSKRDEIINPMIERAKSLAELLAKWETEDK